LTPTFDTRVALVLLVDRRGRILMQHRTTDAPIAPGRWGLPGGHVEHAEDPLAAAHRELLEETALTVDRLDLWWRGTVPGRPGADVFAYHGSTTATDADIVLGEGQAMLFLEPPEILARELAATASLLVPAFIRSPEYVRGVSSRP
jgi:8-oxo-dGTP diphosphatase